MKIISKNRNDTRREVIINGETKHIRFSNGQWWMSKDGTRGNLVPVKGKKDERTKAE